jgi:sugar phosphate isomerase/epimerase
MILFPVSISLGSYGADEVRARGQDSFIQPVADAGASHIELREELGLGDPRTTASAIERAGLTCIYSAPIELWLADQAAPNPAVAVALEAARAHGAVWLKVSLGHFSPSADLDALATWLSDHPVHLLVENDQTEHGGRIEPLLAFFDKAATLHVPVGMTFDIGNWQWQAQSPFDAALALGHVVEYVHCKGVQRQPERLRAAPPSPEDLQHWQLLLARMPGGIVRAVEFPLQGDDLLAVTRHHVDTLARLGQAQEEQGHG